MDVGRGRHIRHMLLGIQHTVYGLRLTALVGCLAGLLEYLMLYNDDRHHYACRYGSLRSLSIPSYSIPSHPNPIQSDRMTMRAMHMHMCEILLADTHSSSD
jgi:hypothetical protein